MHVLRLASMEITRSRGEGRIAYVPYVSRMVA